MKLHVKFSEIITGLLTAGVFALLGVLWSLNSDMEEVKGFVGQINDQIIKMNLDEATAKQVNLNNQGRILSGVAEVKDLVADVKDLVGKANDQIVAMNLDETKAKQVNLSNQGRIFSGVEEVKRLVRKANEQIAEMNHNEAITAQKILDSQRRLERIIESK